MLKAIKNKLLFSLSLLLPINALAHHGHETVSTHGWLHSISHSLGLEALGDFALPIVVFAIMGIAYASISLGLKYVKPRSKQPN